MAYTSCSNTSVAQLMQTMTLLLPITSDCTACRCTADHAKHEPALTRTSRVLAQFGEFLQKAMSPADYAKLLPPLDSLVVEYGLDPVNHYDLALCAVYRTNILLLVFHTVEVHRVAALYPPMWSSIMRHLSSEIRG